MSADATDGAHLLRVRADDPEYRRRAAAEAAYWHAVHPESLELLTTLFSEGPVDRYVNRRFTGDPRMHWSETIARWGTFERGLLLGTSSFRVEERILKTNRQLHLTILDLSAGPLERRRTMLGERFPGRVATQVGDLNFATMPEAAYDVVISSSTIHHVTNLEYLAFQIGRALAPGGYFFLDDYVGEPRFGFSDAKKRLFEALYARDLARQPGRKPGLVWKGPEDLSPFCGIRSDEILDVFGTFLPPVQVRTASALTVPLVRLEPADLAETWRPTRLQILWALLKRRLGILRPDVLDPRFLEELFVVGDAASDAGLIRPGVAFAVYRKA